MRVNWRYESHYSKHVISPPTKWIFKHCSGHLLFHKMFTGG